MYFKKSSQAYGDVASYITSIHLDSRFLSRGEIDFENVVHGFYSNIKVLNEIKLSNLDYSLSFSLREFPQYSLYLRLHLNDSLSIPDYLQSSIDSFLNTQSYKFFGTPHIRGNHSASIPFSMDYSRNYISCEISFSLPENLQEVDMIAEAIMDHFRPDLAFGYSESVGEEITIALDWTLFPSAEPLAYTWELVYITERFTQQNVYLDFPESRIIKTKHAVMNTFFLHSTKRQSQDRILFLESRDIKPISRR